MLSVFYSFRRCRFMGTTTKFDHFYRSYAKITRQKIIRRVHVKNIRLFCVSTHLSFFGLQLQFRDNQRLQVRDLVN